jgi:hypothetical protein
MHAEYATGSPEPEPFEESESFALVFASTCATFAPPDESPQAEASRESPTTPASASARSAARLTANSRPSPSVLFVPRSPSRLLSSPMCVLIRFYEVGSFSTVTWPRLRGGLRRALDRAALG